jgi:probable rRNA maturation factor
MSLDVTVSMPAGRAPLARARIADAARAALRAQGVRHALVSVTLLDRRAMARLNREHLGHAGATDVISFGFSRATPDDPVIGDIYICPAVARAHAEERTVPVREELIRLVVHGVLHVLGHDHPPGDDREDSAMWRAQERLVRRLTAPPDERTGRLRRR